MTAYSGWAEIDRLFRAATHLRDQYGKSITAAEAADAYVHLERDCVAISHGLGLPVGPRWCRSCGGAVLLDDDGEAPDPDRCAWCEKRAWHADYAHSAAERAEILRLGAMTLDEIEADREARLRRATTSAYTQMRHYTAGLLKRDVQ